MRDAALKYALFYGILFFGGVPAWWLTSRLTDTGGGPGTSLLNNTAPVVGLLLGVGVLLLALGLGYVSARLISPRAGLLNAGLVLAWGGAGLGTVRTIVTGNAAPDTAGGARGVLLKLTVEAALIGVALVAGVWLLERLTGPQGQQRDERKATPLLTLLGSAAGMAAGVWLIAQSGLKGQVVGAALVGGVIAGVAAVAIDPGALVNRLWPLVAGCVLVAVLGPLVGWLRGGNDSAIHAAAIAGTLPRLSTLTGFDAFAGACLGIPVGLYIGRGLLGHAGKVAERVGE